VKTPTPQEERSADALGQQSSRVSRTTKEVRDVGIGLYEVGAVQEMEDIWLSGVALRGEASNRPMLRWLKTVVVNDWEKAHTIASGGDREDDPERLTSADVDEAS
jgi:hypothetical protein